MKYRMGKTRGFAAIKEIVTLGILQKMEPCLVNNHSPQNILKQKRDKRRGEQRRGKGPLAVKVYHLDDEETVLFRGRGAR